jgi:hypothetical protein
VQSNTKPRVEVRRTDSSTTVVETAQPTTKSDAPCTSFVADAMPPSYRP